MMPGETMTWAGPLPSSEAEAAGNQVMTFAGPLASVAAERSGAEESGGPIMWAGPLPAWMDRGGSKALTLGTSFSAPVRI
jgi:hypothetical protein